MTSLTARIQPASRSARPVLASVGAALRELDTVSGPADQELTVLPGLGTLVLTESPGELVLSFTGPDATAATVRGVISQQVRHAAGSRSAAAKLVITWVESEPSA